MASFSVDLTTGVLTFDDTGAPFPMSFSKINETDLLADGYGLFYVDDGRVYVNDEPMIQPDRVLTPRATITLAAGGVIVTDDVINFRSSMDIGTLFPVGQTPVGKYSIALDNSERQWDYNGSLLGADSIEGAVVYVQIGAADEDGVIQYSPFGRFVVDKIESQDDSPIIVMSGLDYMGNKMLTPFVEITPGAHIYVQDYLDQIQALTGVVIIPSYSYNDELAGLMSYPAETTCRQVLGEIAQFSGCNAIIDAFGVCVFKTLAYDYANKILIMPQVYKRMVINLPYSLYNYRLDYTYNEPSPPYTAGEGSVDASPAIPGAPIYAFTSKLGRFLTGYRLFPAFITQYALAPLAEQLRLSTGGIVEWVGTDGIEVGDICLITKPNGQLITIPIFQHNVVYDGSLTFESGCDLASYIKKIGEV